MAKHKWDVLLRPNTLTPDNQLDCIAEVRNPHTTRLNEDIADKIVKERSEFRKDTILNILNLRDQAVKEFIEDGDSFRDGLIQLSPRVSGVWENETSPFDPQVHRRTLDMTMTASLRGALEEVGVNIVGKKDATSKISSVTNSVTGLKDNSAPIGDDIIIEGDKIKIQDESDEAQGVFFVDSTGAEHRVSRKLTDNKPSRLTARVPSDIAEGELQLVIRTRYSGTATPLKTLREIKYAYPLNATK